MHCILDTKNSSRRKNMNRSMKTRNMVMTGVFAAIMILMTSIPFLGYIPIGAIRATLIHIPVIVGAIILGPKYGALLGFIFGCTSLFTNTFSPTPASFVFSPFYTAGDFGGGPQSLIICFVPRILIGVVAYYVYILLKKILSRAKINKAGAQTISLVAAGLAGSLTNTLLVMNLIYFLFQDGYSVVRGVSAADLYQKVIIVTVTVNGIPEAIVAAIFTTAICTVLLRLNKQT